MRRALRMMEAGFIQWYKFVYMGWILELERKRHVWKRNVNNKKITLKEAECRIKQEGKRVY
jgi:hypothetical protein